MTDTLTTFLRDPAVVWPVVIGAGLIGAAWDVATGRIPNLLTATVLITGLSWALATGSWSGLGLSLATAAMLMLPFFVLFVIAGAGAGDAKLMAGIGAWLGPQEGLIVLLCVVLAGGVLSVLVAIRRRAIGTVLMNVGFIAWLVRRNPTAVFKSLQHSPLPDVRDTNPMPYGPAIFVGTVVAAVVLWK